MINLWKRIYALLPLAGIVDAGYLTREHYSSVVPPCAINTILADCGTVLRSQYATIYGIPLALLGLIHYTIFFFFFLGFYFTKQRIYIYLLLLQSFAGFLFSLYLIYLQLGVIGAICIYCMTSALISFCLFLATHTIYHEERKRFAGYVTGFLYINLLKPILFQIDPEKVHAGMMNFGETLAKNHFYKIFMRFLFRSHTSSLRQEFFGITFPSPIGLAAGFDYEARLTQALEPIGFGFQTVGTITNNPYEGNPRPMLGRLPKSKSLMVNKGFKNLGAAKTINRLNHLSFPIPLGISIGKTNTLSLKTQKDGVEDIVKAFKKFEKAKITNSYYELNISCPNLKGNISFYPPKNLKELLVAIDKIKLKKPLFVKMPIEKTEEEILEMLKVIDKSSVKGIIFGNLQKNRNHPSLDKSEVAKFSVGYFSGKPTEEDSNRLIELVYKKYKKRFLIIGCGGVFSGKDAYEKIIRGASLIQFITGMIYEGPQQASLIAFELADLLEKNGFSHLNEAIGSKYNIRRS